MSPLTRNQSLPPSTPPWLPEVTRDLAELAWPEEPVAVPSRAHREAEAALRLVADLGLRPRRLLPGLDGGVLLTFAQRDRYAELEFLDGGGAVATCFGPAPEATRVWPVDSTELRTALHKISKFLGG